MNVHFLNHNSKEADKWSLYGYIQKALDGGQVKVYCDQVDLSYRIRMELVVFKWPKLLFSATRLAFRSVRSTTAADIVVVDDHVQLWPIWFVYRLLAIIHRRRPRIVYLGFIYTPRSALIVAKLRQAYFAQVLQLANHVWAYSKVECLALRHSFPTCRAHFDYVHFGLDEHATIREYIASLRSGDGERALPGGPTERIQVFSAGRSSRDYATLVEGFGRLALPADLTVVCDSYSEFSDGLLRPNVRVLRSCYADQYSAELIKASVVVVPLTNPEISAGQMVVMHGLACGKYVIVTETPITREYFSGIDCVAFIRQGAADELADAIETAVERISAEPHAIFLSARSVFELRFNIDCFAKCVAERLLGLNGAVVTLRNVDDSNSVTSVVNG